MATLNKDKLADALDAHKEPLTREEIEKFPAIKYLTPRDEVIMACVVMGVSQAKIGQAFGIAQPTVHEIIRRLDPMKMYRRDRNAKKAILADMALQNAAGAQRYITEEKMVESSAKDLVSMQGQWVKIGNDLTQAKHSDAPPSKLDDILQDIESATEVEEEEHLYE